MNRRAPAILKVGYGSNRNLPFGVADTRPTGSLSISPRLAYRANSNAITASNAHTLPKPINAIRLSHARVASRES